MIFEKFPQTLAVLLFLFLGFEGCLIDNKKPCSNPIPKIPEQNLTVILVDISGSFNKLNNDTSSNSKNYLSPAIADIKNFISKLPIGNAVFIGSISSIGFDDNRFFSKIEICDSSLCFLQQEPCDPFKKKEYDYLKVEHEKNTKNQIEEKRKLCLRDLVNFELINLGHPSSLTNICCSVESSFLFLRDNKYKNYNKKLILYSDMKDEPGKDCCSPIDCQGIDISMKFVITDGHTPQSFQDLESKWKKYFCNAKNFEFSNPARSSNR